MDDLMPIGEFSDRSGLSPRRLRSYASAGLLVPAAVDSASGYRYYAPGQLREARVIDTLREAGIPLADIGALLRQPSSEVLDAWATRLEEDASQRRQALDEARRLLAIDAVPSPTAGRERSGRAAMTTLRTATRTDTGRVRESNQDAVAGRDRLAVIADGMGGHPRGDLAAGMAVALVDAAFTGQSADELQAAVRAANRAIWDRANGADDLDGMGTTICAAGVIQDGTLSVVHVGDTRAYRSRRGTLTALTADHTLTAEAVRRGELSEEQARHHPHRSVLTRALGVGPDVELDCAAHEAVVGDRFLLCSDGLFNEMADDEIAALMSAGDGIQATADALVELALSRGGRDNVSVVVAEVVA